MASQKATHINAYIPHLMELGWSGSFIKQLDETG